MIEIKNLHKFFGKAHILKGVNLQVRKGDVAVIVGPSGSGKSTLLRCINRLEEIQEGEIWIDGENVCSKSSNVYKVRAEVGMVFQQFNLFPHMNALQNVTLGPILTNKKPKKEAEPIGYGIIEEGGTLRKRNFLPLPALWRTATENRHCPCFGHAA